MRWPDLVRTIWWPVIRRWFVVDAKRERRGNNSRRTGVVDPQESSFLKLLVHRQLLHLDLLVTDRKLSQLYQRKVDGALRREVRFELILNSNHTWVSLNSFQTKEVGARMREDNERSRLIRRKRSALHQSEFRRIVSYGPPHFLDADQTPTNATQGISVRLPREGHTRRGSHR